VSNIMTDAPDAGVALLYHFCRMQLPAIVLTRERVREHLHRTLAQFQAKTPQPVAWSAYLASLYSLDWYLCCGCLQNLPQAWEMLFAMRTGRSDCLLLDALRARAIRLYPRDEEKQESAVTEFWSQLIVSKNAETLPIMARYDGQRPLAPWLIRVFQNWHISILRSGSPTQSMPEDDTIALPMPGRGETRWHEAFCEAARDWLATLSEQELLILGLRWRYRLSQREVGHLLKVHEGTISRQTDRLRDRCLESISKNLTDAGWAGENLAEYILTEMGGLLVDEPKLSFLALRTLLATRGVTLEVGIGQSVADS